ncbi:Enamine deaminase RidA, house cleaning of reactive enamine intermediates, YjgF/YER057c/UK114 family [Mucilaginibacter gossypiicola]|uniref:Enamine deaminase RidA, house cleaning of reactive enamine intermediates, YjgF/YER057c/UK114 family n=1 Tax=Mucilaginibacter gossypiicola TaxID=551995 RepID=A0A1H7ZS13_9SPHI|nr:RidA family protein [Mucilaginibacter gossypiicola]SEM60594.1 Enamine deaminase RidA, house cleaning of reactive enamine intermediates, YjgF/YER057c/UK114 family [Mucilaginibacter gossypiicola]
MKKILYLILFSASSACFAQEVNKDVTFLNPATVGKPFGYSHAVIVDLGKSKMVIMSGQVGLDKDGKLAGNGDLANQTEQIFTNIKNIVEAAGGTMNDIVELNYYLMDASQVQLVRGIRDKFVNTKQPPASTLVQVSKLFRDDILIEIKATAIIRKK